MGSLHFSEIFKRDFPEQLKKVDSFAKLQQNFKGWGGVKAPMTNKQNRALAVEAQKMGIKNVSIQVRFMRNGKQQIRYKDSISGIWTRLDGTFKSKGKNKK